MKPGAEMFILRFSFALPLLGFLLYRVFTHPENLISGWFLYFFVCYGFVCFIIVFAFRFKQIRATAQSPDLEARIARSVSLARRARRLGYFWLIVPIIYFLAGEQLQEPVWVTALVLSSLGFFSWVHFFIAKKIEMGANRNPA